MKVSELYRHVAQLGFEDSLESDARFIYSANSALLQINNIRPLRGAYVINHKPLENRAHDTSFLPMVKNRELIFEATDVKAYYFEADGRGVAYAERYDALNKEWVELSFIELTSRHTFNAYRGFFMEDGEFIRGRVRLRFTGDFIYNVRGVAMYSEIFSEDESDIPAYEAYTRYDMSLLIPDFLSLAEVFAFEENGYRYLTNGYIVENGRVILLPYEKGGLYKITYNRRLRSIISTEDELPIDLDEDLCALMPFLVASVYYLDDEPEKAQYYRMLYNEMAIDIERRAYNASPVIIRSSNGW